MTQSTSFTPSAPAPSSRDALTELLRDGACDLIAAALEAEIQVHLSAFADQVDSEGHRLVVRNGYLPEREIQTGIGAVKVRQPRVRDQRADADTHFTSKILPPYLRRTKSMEELLPWLYLKGISTGGFQDALTALLGPDAPGLSASTVVRLKKIWEEDYRKWSQRSLANKRYVYLWVDGIHFNIRLEQERSCILVIMGATASGK